MPDGELRRPPQLWEQRLTRMTSVLSVGLGTSGDTSIVEPTPAPGGDSGVEPAPVLPPPGEFIKPSTPSLIGQVQGINVIWDGLNSAGDLWPYDTSWVEVHLDTTGTAFTPGTATLQGRLSRPGNFYLGGLTSGTAYYVKLMGADPAGNYTEPSDAATGFTGLTTSSDYGTATIGTGVVSFNARQIGGVTSSVGTATPTSPVVGDIWLDTTGGSTVHKRWNGSSWEVQQWGAGSIGTAAITEVAIDTAAITAAKLAAGAVTEVKIDSSAVTAAKLAGSAVTETKIASDAITAPKIAANAVEAVKIAAGAVSADKIAAGAVEADKIAANAVTAVKIAAGSIETAKLAAGAVTAEKVAASAIEADKIAANAVTAGKIAANAVTATTIAGSAITADKLAANSVTATSLAAGAVTAGAIAAGAVTTDKLTAGTINGFYITGSTISAGYLSGGTISSGYISGGTLNGALVTGGTIQGPLIKTAASGGRVELNSTYGADSVMWYDSGGSFVGSIGPRSGGIGVLSSLYVSGKIRPYTSTADLFLMAGTASGDSAYLNCQNVYDQTSGSSANVVVGAAGKILRSTSRAAEKYRIVPLVHELANVPANKISTPEVDGAVDMWDVLDLAPAQFARHEDSQRVVDPDTGEEITPAPEVTYLGFIAEDVAAKFPVAAEWDEAGDPSSYDVRAIVSALLGVVSEQQATITALTARIEALEA